MNPNNEHSSNTDAKVSAAYRELATEIPPSRLDDIVLRHAAEETRQTRGIAGYLYSFRRPLAFAATLVLALGIVLQFDSVMTGTTLNSTNGISAPGDASAGAGNTSAVIDANVEHIQQQMKQSVRDMTEDLLRQPTTDSNSIADATNAEPARFCGKQQPASAELWWACITDLERNGRHDAAAHERQLLTNTYPDFLPAE